MNPAPAQAWLRGGAHALMGVAMVLMLAGRPGPGAGLGWALVFAAVALAGAFGPYRAELLIGCAAMVFMLLADPPSGVQMSGMQMSGHVAAGHATVPTGFGPFQAAALGLIVALGALSAVALTRLADDRTVPWTPTACRVGLNLAAAAMLVAMI